MPTPDPATERPPRRRGLRSLLADGGLAVWMTLGIVLLVIGFRRQEGAAAEAAPVRPAAAAALVSASPKLATPAARTYVPDYELKSGTEVTLVLVGASFCGANRKAGFAEAVEEAKLRVRDQAKARGHQFRAVAVSLDWEPREALAFLEGFGAFDEISVGSNWVNDSAVRYVWRDHPGDPVLPQMIVLERRIDAEPAVRVHDERVLSRVLGADDILEWVRAGAKVQPPAPK